MNAATPTPIRPSSTSQPVTRHSTAAISTALVLSTSLRLSAAVAMRVSEPMMRPMVRLKDVYKRQALGAVSRLAGEAFGSAMTFANPGQASAPGQVSLEVVNKVLDALHL